MAEIIQCDHCGQTYPYNAKLAGKRVKCKKCGQAFQIPAAPEPAGPETLAPLGLGTADPFQVDLAAAAAHDAASPTSPLGPARTGASRRRKQQLRKRLLLASSLTAGLALVGLAGWGIVVLISNAGEAISSANSKPKNEWREYQYPEDNYSVSFPGPPTASLTGDGTYDREWRKDGVSFRVMLSWGPGMKKPERLRWWLDTMLRPQPLDRETVVEQKRILLQGKYPGWKATHKSAPAVNQYRKYVVDGTRSYVLYVWTLRGKENDPDIERFFNSFRLLKPPEKPIVIEGWADSP
ncbi:MAG: hypothetical protein JW818_06185 [Pirellulales bacterium]|nr:hypothetical protein [Pirellulales bacterium]